jgi:hypothetical protein
VIRKASQYHSLLQATGYAAALLGSIAAAHRAPGDSREASQARVDRQRLLDEDGKSSPFVIEEPVLRFRIGDNGVMAGQLRHLADALSLPSVSVGVIPAQMREQSPEAGLSSWQPKVKKGQLSQLIPGRSTQPSLVISPCAWQGPRVHRERGAVFASIQAVCKLRAFSSPAKRRQASGANRSTGPLRS